MAIKNGRYKDKNGNIRHFETNENMVVVDNGQKTLKQKLSSLLESFSDLIKRITALESNKIDKAQIKNNLDETEVGNVLDASQGKALGDRLGVLESNRGYLNSKSIASLSEITANGKYNIYNSSEMPTQGRYVIDAICHASNYIHLEANGIYGNSLGLKYQRVISGSSDTGWQQIATTDNGFNGLLKRENLPTDFNNIRQVGKYHYVGNIANIVNCPPNMNGGNTRFILTVESDTHEPHIIKQTIECVDGDNIGVWICSYDNTNNSRKWQQIATTTTTTIDFPYASGYTAQHTGVGKNCIKQNNRVTVYINIKKTDSSPLSNGYVIGTLPAGWRPSHSVIGTIRGSSEVACHIEILNNGQIVLRLASNLTNVTWLFGYLEFYVD